LLILAGLSLICGICANAMAISVPFIPDDGQPPRPEDPFGSALASLRFVAKEVPGYLAIMIVGTIATLAFGIAQLVAGIGLLRLSPAARKLAIAVTVISFIYGLAMQIYTGALVLPVQVQFEKEKPRPQGLPDMSPVTMMTGMFQIGCTLAFQLTITIVIVVGLNTQSAKIAFGVLPPPPEESDEDDRPRRKIQGYDDDD
jgi:hypothetical protein